MFCHILIIIFLYSALSWILWKCHPEREAQFIFSLLPKRNLTELVVFILFGWALKLEVIAKAKWIGCPKWVNRVFITKNSDIWAPQWDLINAVTRITQRWHVDWPLCFLQLEVKGSESAEELIEPRNCDSRVSKNDRMLGLEAPRLKSQQIKCSVPLSFIHKYNCPYPFQLLSITGLTPYLFRMCSSTALLALPLHINLLASLWYIHIYQIKCPI